MGRFDILTQIETKPRPLTPKEGVPSPAPQPESSKHSLLHANLQTGFQVKKQTSKEENPQASKEANLQTSKPANTQTRIHVCQYACKSIDSNPNVVLSIDVDGQ